MLLFTNKLANKLTIYFLHVQAYKDIFFSICKLTTQNGVVEKYKMAVAYNITGKLIIT